MTSARARTAGFVAVVAVLQALALVLIEAGVGLGLWSWLGTAGHLVGLFWLILRRSDTVRLLAPANLVTLTRALLAGLVLALMIAALLGNLPAQVPMVALAVVAVLLDGVDGQVARRTRTTSEFGARFDMEADAFVILILSLYVALTLAWWTAAIGLMRYGFVLASLRWSWLSGSLPPKMSRKVVAALQMITLPIAASALLPPMITMFLVAASLAALTWSFARDIVLLRRR